MSHHCNHESHSHDFHESHSHDHDSPERGLELNLFQQIDVQKAWCLNERVPHSVQTIFKPWSERLTESLPQRLHSDTDAELLIHVPFTACVVKLKSIGVRGPLHTAPQHAPSKMRAWINRDDMDFDLAASVPPVQEWDLVESPPGGEVVEYPTRMTKFSQVRSVTLWMPSNFTRSQDEETIVTYLGFRGEWEPLTRDAPLAFVYESRANPADHPQAKQLFSSSHQHVSGGDY